jgi:hypothetical protein
MLGFMHYMHTDYMYCNRRHNKMPL